MKQVGFRIVCCIVFGFLTGFSEIEKAPGELISEASQFIESAKSAEESSYAEAYKLYLSALERIDLIFTKYPDSPVTLQISNGATKVGPYSLSQFKDKILPEVKRKADAEAHPMITALLIAETTEDPAFRHSVLWNAIRYYAKAGQDDRVLEIAALAHRIYKISLLIISATAYHESGQTKKAFSVLDTAYRWALNMKLEHRALSLSMIGHHYLEHGEKEKAMALLTEALEAANSIKDTNWFDKADAYSLIAIGYAKVGQREKALSLFSESIGLRKNPEWMYIVEYYTEAGLFENALESVKKIQLVSNQATMLSKIAIKLAHNGQQARALELLSEAVRITARDQNANEAQDKVRRLLYLFNGSREIGDKDFSQDLLRQADQLIQGVEDPNTKVMLLPELAEAYFHAGDQERSMDLLAEGLQLGEQVRSVSIEPLIVGYAKVGRVEQAVSMARRLTPPGQARSAFEKIGNVLADKGLTDSADALLTEALQIKDSLEESIQGDLFRETLLMNTAGTYIKMGNRARAINLLDQRLEMLTRRKVPPSAFELIFTAYRYAEAGNNKKAIMLLKQALEATQATSDDSEKDKDLGEIAEGFAKAGQYSEALSLTKRIQFEDTKILTLTNIAGSMEKAGERSKSVETLSQAFQIVLGEPHPPNSWLLNRLGSEFLKVDQVEEAIRVAGIMEEGREKIELLLDISEKYLDKNDKAKTLSFLNKVNIEKVEYAPILEVAKMWAKLGDKARTTLLLNQVRDQADERVVYFNSKSTERLAWIVASYVEAGFYDQGFKIAQSTTKGFLEGTRWIIQGGMWQVIESLAKAGEYEKASVLLSNAVQFASKVDPKEGKKASLLRKIGESYLKIGKREKGLEILREAFAEAERYPEGGTTLGKIGISYMNAGEKEQAFKAFSLAVKPLRTVFPEWMRAIELGSIALSMANNMNEVDARSTKLLHEIIRSMF